MGYFSDVCSPETWWAFRRTDRSVTGLREDQLGSAERVDEGDIFLCYLTGLSRWCGALEVQCRAYLDRDPRPGYGRNDPFTVRFRVKPLVVLDPESAIPIKEPPVWNQLSFTKGRDPKSSHWTGPIRRSLNRISDDDGAFLLELLKERKTSPKACLLTDKDKRLLARIRKALPRSGAR